jgi:hypothetical protein
MDDLDACLFEMDAAAHVPDDATAGSGDVSPTDETTTEDPTAFLALGEDEAFSVVSDLWDPTAKAPPLPRAVLAAAPEATPFPQVGARAVRASLGKRPAQLQVESVGGREKSKSAERKRERERGANDLYCARDSPAVGGAHGVRCHKVEALRLKAVAGLLAWLKKECGRAGVDFRTPTFERWLLTARHCQVSTLNT